MCGARGWGSDYGGLQPRPRDLDCILRATGATECLETFFKQRSHRSKQCFGTMNVDAAWEGRLDRKGSLDRDQPGSHGSSSGMGL